MKPKTSINFKPFFMLLGSTLISSAVVAAPSEELIGQYNLAAEGDKGKVKTVLEQLNSQIESNGADALSLVYLGSTQTMQGRDAFMPWNKMKYTEQGLATISKGLTLAEEVSVEAQEYRQGLPEGVLAKAIAASTFTSLPDMFNHFERGYDLYLDLLADNAFAAYHFDVTSWVYLYAIEASVRAEDFEQANQWLTEMKSHNALHPMTQKAAAFIDDNA